MVPWISRFVPRRWVYTGGAALYLVAAPLAMIGGPVLTPLALLTASLATVTVFICTNAYVMDYIARHELGGVETLKMLYSALSWAAGPMVGVMLWKYWEPLPFLVAMGSAAALLATFWYMRLGNGKLITRAARAPAPNPLAYLGRFFRQPRLIAGWLFAVLRSSGWWVYVVYLPIFCIEAGLGDQVASVAFSLSNSLLFLSPLMLRWMQRQGLRRAIRLSFAACAACFPRRHVRTGLAAGRGGRIVRRVDLSRDARHVRRPAVPDGGETGRADRDVSGLFKLPRRLGYRHAGRGMGGASRLADRRHLRCLCRRPCRDDGRSRDGCIRSLASRGFETQRNRP